MRDKYRREMESERVRVRGVKLTNKMNEECACASTVQHRYHSTTNRKRRMEAKLDKIRSDGLTMALNMVNYLVM